ncbi:hypothetical protein PGT21_031035 [Puccinia graminis f. sp. tritici]|uniref:Uncharacterized protein n=1 Tax=Puccinia graminis f. sp. tritici TaxID=56615 RepID=A0A5B0MQC1_PUCGR|nr:hypothetical protein PGT21_031035 [Puccinia graminis f. sp. tritici]
MPISIPGNTVKILAQLRLPTNSSIVDRIFHASTGLIGAHRFFFHPPNRAR